MKKVKGNGHKQDGPAVGGNGYMDGGEAADHGMEGLTVPNHTGGLQAEIELPPGGELDLLIRSEVKAQLAAALLQGLASMLSDGRAYVVELGAVGVKLGDVRRGLRSMDQELTVTLADVPTAGVGEHIWLKTLPGTFWDAPEGAVVAVSVPMFDADTDTWQKEGRYFVRDRVGFRRFERSETITPQGELSDDDDKGDDGREGEGVQHDAAH